MKYISQITETTYTLELTTTELIAINQVLGNAPIADNSVESKLFDFIKGVIGQ